MLKRLACWVFGHRYWVVQHFTPETRRVACHRCKGSWGMNDRVQAIIPWDADLEAMYRDLFNHQIINPF